MSLISINIEQGGTLVVKKSDFTNAKDALKSVTQWMDDHIEVSTTDGKLVDTDWLSRDVTPLDEKDVVEEYYGFMLSAEAVVTIDTNDDVEDVSEFGYTHLCLSFEKFPKYCDFNVKHTEMIDAG